MNKIPKVIHYFWFGRKPLPELAHKCISSWRKYMPEYEIREWNETNFDVRICTYTEEAYCLKKYALVSDYARLWVLFNHGGIYFDTDVELIRPIDDILERGAFMGEEDFRGASLKSREWVEARALGMACNPGLGMACAPRLPEIEKLLLSYENGHVVTWTGRLTDNIVTRTTRMLSCETLEKCHDGTTTCGNLIIYPIDFFDPINYFTGETTITKNTRSIHHYAASWVSDVPVNPIALFISKVSRHLKCVFVRLIVALKRTIRKTFGNAA